MTLEGLRSNEARMLDVEDVRFAEQELVVRFAKGGKRRTIVLFDDAAEHLLNWLAVRPEPKPGHETALLLTTVGRRIANRTIRDDAKRWAAAAGLPADFHAHSCRHTSVVRQREAGMSLEAVRDHHGHSSVAITDMYSHLTPAAYREEAEKVNRR